MLSQLESPSIKIFLLALPPQIKKGRTLLFISLGDRVLPKPRLYSQPKRENDNITLFRAIASKVGGLYIGDRIKGGQCLA